jgi:2-polyprenyl-3-methyl-5-hydroxy-6-metoxy-1,4-benzoquinol methylase
LKAAFSANHFTKIYRDSVDEVIARMPADWSAISKHNVGWRKERFDASQYLRDSERRYAKVLKLLPQTQGARILDVGGFLAAFPLTLRRLGYEVTIAEKFDYYGNALDGIAQLLADNDVTVIDKDFTESSDMGSLRDTFDGVTCMAVAEHLAHSPRDLIENIHSVLRPGGDFAFEVPNLAFWPRRYSFFFKGNTVLAPMDDVYHSAIPFTGHHREYTIDDARYVIKQGKFEIVDEYFFNYGINTRNVWHIIKYAPAFLFREWAGMILIHARK